MRGRPRQSHCKRGHRLDRRANVYVDKQGRRKCRKCHPLHQDQWHRKRQLNADRPTDLPVAKSPVCFESFEPFIVPHEVMIARLNEIIKVADYFISLVDQGLFQLFDPLVEFLDRDRLCFCHSLFP